MRIGIIGLGAMGQGIAAKLATQGHALTLWNRSPVAWEAPEGAEARFAADLADACANELVLSVLFDDDAIRATLLDGGALCHLPDGGIHACLSTVSLAFGRELMGAHEAAKARYAGLPMLGRPEAIAAHGVNLLAGGPADVLDAVEPVTDAFATMRRIGPSPLDGQAAKLAANFMITGALEAMAEAAAMLEVHGVDRNRFFSAMTDTLFAAPIYKANAPMMSGHPPPVASGLTLPLKDNASFLAAVAEAGLKAPLAETVRALLTQAVVAGHGKMDWSTALAELAQQRG